MNDSLKPWLNRHSIALVASDSRIVKSSHHSLSTLYFH